MRVASATGGKPDDAGLERALATLVPIADAAAGLAPHRFLVDEPETLWLVTHGRLNLFAVELHEGQPVGPRRFLWSAEAPSAVFGLAPAPAARPFAVLADAGAATVCRLPLAALRALGAQPEGASAALALVGSFVAEASAAMGRTRAPQLRHELAPGQSIAIGEGETAGAAHALIWVRHESGRSLFAGTDGAVISAEDGAIPIGRGLWISPQAGPAQLVVNDAPAAWERGQVWNGLDRFRTLFACWLAAHSIAVETSERARLRRKATADREMREEGLAGLAALLGDARHLPVPTAVADPLLAACRAVGQLARIDFRSPPTWEVERKVRDPLASICRVSRVQARRVALRGRWWRSGSAPMLAYRADDRRPVALLPVRHGRYEMLDPAEGQRVAVDGTVANGLDPFAFEFYQPPADRPMTLADLGGMLLAALRGDLARLLLAAFAGSLLGLALPIATGKVFSEIIPMAVPGNVVPLLVTLAGLTLGTTLFDLTRAFALIRIEGRANASLQAAVVSRLLALPIPFFREYSVGDLSTRAAGINAVRDLLSGAAITTVLSGAFSVVNLLLLCYYSWRLTLVAVGALLVTVVVTSAFGLATIRLERRRQSTGGVVAGLVFEMLGGIAKLRVAGAEGRAFAVWTAKFRDQREVAFRAGVYQSCATVFTDVLPLLSNLALFGAAGYLIAHQGALATGDFIAFNAAFGSFFASGVHLSNTLLSLLNIVPIVERAKPILETKLEAGAAKPDPGELTGRIEVNHVSFWYDAGGPPILEDVSLHALPGEFVALVGPSGSGKSTLLRLLLGFEPPASGAVYYDGQDLSVVDLTAVRAQIGVVLQTSRLMAGDIFMNIVGSAPLTVDDAWKAAEMAGLADDIRSMPMGMQTMVSEGGATLSGGQRQRLLIARALVRRPAIVLFDEATSALDNETQDVVTRSLEDMKATRIVIAHRLSTIRKADRIYVMDRGRVVQHGSYAELSQAPGLFADLIARQIA